MDNATHALIGYSIYAGLKKEEMEKDKKWYILAAVLGAELPDLEAVTRFWGNDVYLVWHRHFTHSIFFSPIMALLVIGIIYLFGRKKKLSWKTMYLLAFLAVCSHWLSDYLNTWGTGLLEPFVHERYSLGFLPIIDIVILSIMGIGFYLRKKIGTQRAFRWVWSLLLIYVLVQGAQNLWLKQQYADRYDKLVVAADFVPGSFTVVGKSKNRVEIFSASLFSEGRKTVLHSNEDPDLVKLVLQDPEAKAIAWFSPIYVVTVEENGAEKRITILDPRFYREGDSFLKKEIALRKQ